MGYQGVARLMENRSITAIEGISVGHSESEKNLTGCTVLLLASTGITAVDARGGWPGTMDTDSIGAAKTFYRKHAVFLTGGDVFGLKCAFGIQRFLLEHGLASKSKPGGLPGIVGANIYDLEFGKAIEKVDYEKLGYDACVKASGSPVAQGNHGAGLGATVGKLRGINHAMKGGVGSTSIKVAGKFNVGALVVTNAIGNVYGTDGATIAGTRKGKRNDEFVEIEDISSSYVVRRKRVTAPRATTIGVVATDLDLSHEETIKVAEMANDGLARCVRPVHTTTDGDVIFAVSTGKINLGESSPDLLSLVGHTAATEVQRSVESAVRSARGLAGIPAASLR
jgi:L-aminopeptidase/D-esterase-like protein